MIIWRPIKRHWKFNLAKSPWWGGLYEGLIKEIQRRFTLGRSHLRKNTPAVQPIIDGDIGYREAFK